MEIEAYLHHKGRLSREAVMRQRLSSKISEQAQALFAGGVRRVVFTEPIGLTEGEARKALDLLRELEAWGMRVEWSAAEVPPEWRPFAHLPPPSGTTSAEEEWRRTFHPGKCVFRQGPGFIEIRDRRSGVLDCYTVDEPHLHDAVHRLSNGVDPSMCDPDAVALFVDHGLLVRVGDLSWWAPARLRRWSVPAMAM